jgi:hypothetical protein
MKDFGPDEVSGIFEGFHPQIQGFKRRVLNPRSRFLVPYFTLVAGCGIDLLQIAYFSTSVQTPRVCRKLAH